MEMEAFYKKIYGVFIFNSGNVPESPNKHGFLGGMHGGLDSHGGCDAV